MRQGIGKGVLRGAGGVALVFGALTIVSGGRALFGGAAMGNVVGFVLWFNFGAGFAYGLAGLGLLCGAQWAGRLALAIAVATLLVFAALGVHVMSGGAYQVRTVAAMTLRSAIWVGIAALALRRGGAG